MKKFVLLPFIFILVFLTVLYSLYYYPVTVGEEPKGEILKGILNSKNYDKVKNGFNNLEVGIVEKMFKNYSMIDSVIKYFSPTTVGWPKNKILEEKDNLNIFHEDQEAPFFAWLGHSTILLRIENKNILIDPVFSDFASPVSFIAKRYQKPVYKLNELPPIDIILLSHDHYDHLDYETMMFFKDKKVKFIAPLGVDSHLVYWGINEEKIETFDWWEEYELGDLKFICTPAQHMSGRAGLVGYKTLWSSWIIQSEKWNIYFSGDSGYNSHFKLIGDKYGPFDYAFIENGQYNERWHAVHLLPDETVKAYHDLKTKRAFPIHWGMFNLSLHHWFTPPLEFMRLCDNCQIDLLPIGKVLKLDTPLIQPSEMFRFLQKIKDKSDR
jgi:L-ascorbate metabolism protein UlaG (beta-lactamase superfamily)